MAPARTPPATGPHASSLPPAPTHPCCCCLPQNPKVTADRAFNGFGTNFPNSPEPIYGTQFLPRKFKVAVTVPGDNSVDIFTNDIGVVVITNEAGELQGFDLLVGGGMGRTHRWVGRGGGWEGRAGGQRSLHLLSSACASDS